jgi:hypothetical protein
MRIRLALEPSSSQAMEPASSVRASWLSWVAAHCPRSKPEEPPKLPETSPANRFAGHPIPKPYQSPFDQ